MKSKISLAKFMAVILVAAAMVGSACIGESWADCKHIILFIGDGMQKEHEIATSRYLFGKDEALSFHNFPYKSYMSTWDVNTYNNWAKVKGEAPYNQEGFNPLVGYDPSQGGAKPYPDQKNHINDDYFILDDEGRTYATDSASAATAWATGIKTDAGNIAWATKDPADGALETIAESLRKKKGFAIGVVSTVPFSHATPAAHVSHNVNRNDYRGIGSEIIHTVQPEVVIGGGHPGLPGYTYLSESDYTALMTGVTNYHFVERTSGLDGGEAILAGADEAIQQSKNLFGLFGGADGNFDYPEPTDTPGAPQVARPSTLDPDLKEATVAALKVLSQDPDGFFVMIEQGDIDWANHANNFYQMVGTTWDLDEAVKAAIDFVNQPGDDVTMANTLIMVTADHSNSYMRLNPDLPLGPGDLPTMLGVDYDHSYPDGEVTYSSTNHTNELVCLYAAGSPGCTANFKKYEGSWYPGTRIVDNTQLYNIMAQAADLDVSDINLAWGPLNATVAKAPFAWGN